MKHEDRRKVIKALTIGAPAVWAKPAVDSVLLPAHGASSCEEIVKFDRVSHDRLAIDCCEENEFNVADALDCLRAQCIDASGIPNLCDDCFLAGTKVLMADGSIKSIDHLVAGDWLASYDFSENRVVHSPVDKLHRGEATSYLSIDGIHVTETHPFAIGNDDWLIAGKLKPKDALVTLDGPVLIDDITRIDQATSIFNMSVANTQNYYVKSGEKFVLVHNK